MSPRFMIKVYFSTFPVSLSFIWILYVFVSAFTSTLFSNVDFSSVKSAREIVSSAFLVVIFTIALFTPVLTYAVYTLFISFIVFPSTCNFCILLFVLCFFIVNVYSFCFVPSSLSTCIVADVTSDTVCMFSFIAFCCFSPLLIPIFEVVKFVVASIDAKSISSVITAS